MEDQPEIKGSPIGAVPHAELFLERLQAEAANFNSLISTGDGDWTVKGFIDVFRNVYTISGDTKVISKIIELMLFPYFVEFSAKFDYRMVPCREQNHYPDITFIDGNDNLFALDLKSTYRIVDKPDTVNTMTLGAFTGYFRDRDSTKNITFPYKQYSGHFVLGVIYSRAEVKSDEFKLYSLEELESIPSVVRDFEFFAQPKYRIAKDQPGSGNTKNIGAVSRLSELVSGAGMFAALGEEVFDDYWMFYLTTDMARQLESKRPYTNLTSYHKYKSGPISADDAEGPEE